MIQIEKTISSIDVAQMVRREHKSVLRDIRTIIVQLGEHKDVRAYFIESYYIDIQDKERPCFQLTKLGCELYGTRMIGEKGTQFAASYIDGSSSKGNNYILVDGESSLMLEAGVPFKDILKSGVSMKNVVGLLVTHEHGDHIKYTNNNLM